MALRVNTNIISMIAQRNLGSVTERLQGNFQRLSSGLRVATAADDPASLGISERMRSQISSLGQASRNAQDGASLVQTAEGALSEVSSNLIRMRELAIQSANGTLSPDDRAIIDVEFQALVEEVDRIANTTNFNGLALLDGSEASLDLQVGINPGETIELVLDDVSASAIGIDVLDVTNPITAVVAMGALDASINAVSESRGALGAAQNRLQSTIRSIANARDNLAASESRIRDVDVASETADLTRNSIMQQAAVSVLGQANVQPQIALQLLQQ